MTSINSARLNQRVEEKQATQKTEEKQTASSESNSSSITQIALNALSYMVTYISQSIHMTYDKLKADLYHGEKAYSYAKNIQEGKYGQTTADPDIYLKKAADSGHIEACYEYSLKLINEDNDIYKDEILSYLKVAADLGHKTASYEYAMQLLKDDESTNHEVAMKYLKKAADLGHDEAAFLYGSQSNSKEATTYLKKAASYGHQEAQERLDIIFQPKPYLHALPSSLSTGPFSITPKDNIEEVIIQRGKELGIDVSDILTLKSEIKSLYLREEKTYTEKSAQRSAAVISKIYQLFTPEIESIKDQEVVFLLGNQKSGKSSTMLHLTGTELESKDPKETKYRSSVLTDKNILVPKGNNPQAEKLIDHGIKPQSFFPIIYEKTLPNHPSVKVVELPDILNLLGWEGKIALNLVIRDMSKQASSLRILTTISRSEITTTAGADAKEIKDKLNRLYINAQDHTLVGLTKTVERKKEITLKNCHDLFDGFECTIINPTDETSRISLENSIMALRPVETDIRQEVITIEENYLLSTTLEQDQNIEEVLSNKLEKYLNSKLNNTPLMGSQKPIITLLNIAGTWFDDLIKETGHESLLASLYPEFADLIALKSPSVTKKIMQFERRLASRIFFEKLREAAMNFTSFQSKDSDFDYSEFDDSEFENFRPRANKDRDFETLKINPNANEQEVKSAYKKLALKFHPDKCKKAPDETDEQFEERKKRNAELFKEISNAYQNLLKS